MFDLLHFIEAKRDGLSNSPEDIGVFVSQIMDGKVKDYHISAWLMAVFLNGMAEDELVSFTRALAESGKMVSFRDRSIVVDKHSTGGVGDKTTLVLVPLVASCGLAIAKLSGRGLGFTGGTVDKLESIPGLKLNMSLENFKQQIDKIGCAIAGHSPDLAPAEAIFYELRDVTATVPSLPLICSSIISKKMAGGAGVFVFDVKYGSGALIKKLDNAKKLANSLVGLSKSLGYASSALITSMEEPLGRWIGNSMEVRESLDVLNNAGPEDTVTLCLALAGEMLFQGGRVSSSEEGIKMARTALENGDALAKFKELIEMQGGPQDLIDCPAKYLPCAPLVYELRAPRDGFINYMDAKAVGEAVKRLGGGRSRKEDVIDVGAAIEIKAKIGDLVKMGDTIMKVYANDISLIEMAEPYISSSVTIGDLTKRPPLIVEKVC